MKTLQGLTVAWVEACWGPEVAANAPERAARLLEEALELAQVMELDRALAHRLVDYVFDRPVGQPANEIGGVALTLAASAQVLGLDVEHCWYEELQRVMRLIPECREKHLAKIRDGITA